MKVKTMKWIKRFLKRQVNNYARRWIVGTVVTFLVATGFKDSGMLFSVVRGIIREIVRF